MRLGHFARAADLWALEPQSAPAVMSFKTLQPSALEFELEVPRKIVAAMAAVSHEKAVVFCQISRRIPLPWAGSERHLLRSGCAGGWRGTMSPMATMVSIGCTQKKKPKAQGLSIGFHVQWQCQSVQVLGIEVVLDFSTRQWQENRRKYEKITTEVGQCHVERYMIQQLQLVMAIATILTCHVLLPLLKSSKLVLASPEIMAGLRCQVSTLLVQGFLTPRNQSFWTIMLGLHANNCQCEMTISYGWWFVLNFVNLAIIPERMEHKESWNKNQPDIVHHSKYHFFASTTDVCCFAHGCQHRHRLFRISLNQQQQHAS